MFSVNGSNPWQMPSSTNSELVGPSANPAAGAAGFNNPSAPALSNPATSGYMAGLGSVFDTINTLKAASPSSFQTSGNGTGQSSSSANPFSNPTFENYSGYNPSQYATMGTANNLAQQLGGNVVQTQLAPGSPFNVPNQNSIYFGGNDALNAGLLAERYAKYDRATADAMTRAELGYMNPGGSLDIGTNQSTFQPVQGGYQGLGGGSNIGAGLGSAYGRPQAGSTAGNSSFGWGQGQGQGFSGGGGNFFGSPSPYSQGYGNPQFQQPQVYRGGFGNANVFGMYNNPFMQAVMGQSPLSSAWGLRGRSPQMGGFNGTMGQYFNPFSMSPNFGGSYSNYFNPWGAQGLY